MKRRNKNHRKAADRRRSRIAAASLAREAGSDHRRFVALEFRTSTLGRASGKLPGSDASVKVQEVRRS